MTAKDEVRRYMLALLTRLRAAFAQRLKVQRQKFPDMRLPCDTCAFRTSTDDWPGMDQTVINFIAALQEGSPFYCHHDMERNKKGDWLPPKRRVNGRREIDHSRMKLCSAWVVLISAPDPIDIADLVPEPIRKAAVEIAAGRWEGGKDRPE